VVAVGVPAKSTKQAAVAVTITAATPVSKAEVAVDPLEVVADNVWVVKGRQTLLMST